MKGHGGNLDEAVAQYGGWLEEWLDLSTGINRTPYPIADLPPRAWRSLPTRAETARLAHVAAQAYGTVAPVVPMAGASAAISLAPLLVKRGKARVIAPTYGEHAAALETHGWKVKTAGKLRDLAGADLAVVVNPNNPDGRRWDPQALLSLSERVGLLIVDESFGDTEPGLSLAPHIGPGTKRIVVQRSFGKFFGLAGLRLGFAISGAKRAERLAELSGPWPVSGAAIAIGMQALADTEWQATTISRLQAGAARLDALAEATGWAVVGGTPLFRTYDTGDAAATHHRLAQAKIWTRAYTERPSWLRIGLPGRDAEWDRLETALR